MCRLYAGQAPARYRPETRHLRLNGQSTSIRLEAAFWAILDGVAAGERISTAAFLSKLHDEVLLHGEAVNFTSILRCTCLVQMERRAPMAMAVGS